MPGCSDPICSRMPFMSTPSETPQPGFYLISLASEACLSLKHRRAAESSPSPPLPHGNNVLSQAKPACPSISMSSYQRGHCHHVQQISILLWWLHQEPSSVGVPPSNERMADITFPAWPMPFIPCPSVNPFNQPVSPDWWSSYFDARTALS